MRRFQHILAIAAAAVALAGVARSDDYQKIDVLDIKLDGEKLADRKIEVTAWMNEISDHWLMQASRHGNSSVYVDIQFLPRAERKELLEYCQQRCPVIVRGTVSVVEGRWGITAESIVVSK
jgi:hypothetical protein